MRGIITNIIDDGTIVTMVVEDRDGAENFVHFDHRPFSHMVEAQGGRPSDIMHREVEVTGDRFEQIVEFDPDPVYADMERDQVAPGD